MSKTDLFATAVPPIDWRIVDVAVVVDAAAVAVVVVVVVVVFDDDDNDDNVKGNETLEEEVDEAEANVEEVKQLGKVSFPTLFLTRFVVHNGALGCMLTNSRWRDAFLIGYAISLWI